MQVKCIAECSKGSILQYFCAILSTYIELTFLFKTFVLSIFEWPLKTGFTVLNLNYEHVTRVAIIILASV